MVRNVKQRLRELDNIRGKLDFDECLLLYVLAQKTIKQFGRDSVLCEIGSFCGKSTVTIAKSLENCDGGHLYAIDWHEGSPGLPGFGTDKYQSTYEEYRSNLKNFQVEHRISTIKSKSEDCIDQVPESIHFLWIDGSHEYDAVEADFDNYHQKLVEGGYLLFHDASWTEWKDPFSLICNKILYNENYNLVCVVENIVVFKKEKNRSSIVNRKLLQSMCQFVSGSGRPFYKRLISAGLRVTTSWYSWNFLINRRDIS